MTSVVAEEFGISPKEAELQDSAQCHRIMALRRFRDAVAAIEGGAKQEDLPKGPYADLALQCMIEIAKGG
jgi:hypothetical protein